MGVGSHVVVVVGIQHSARLWKMEAFLSIQSALHCVQSAP